MYSRLTRFSTLLTHTYSIENVTHGSNTWNINVNGTGYYAVTAFFTVGDWNVAGSEVADGSGPTTVDEYMDNTTHDLLQWRKRKNSGAYVWKPWNSNLNFITDNPYSVVVNSVTSISTNP